MTALVDQVRLADKILDVRDTLRRLHGDRYAEVVAPFRKTIRETATNTGKGVLEIGSKFAALLADDGRAQAALVAIAAMADEAESG